MKWLWGWLVCFGGLFALALVIGVGVGCGGGVGGVFVETREGKARKVNEVTFLDGCS